MVMACDKQSSLLHRGTVTIVKRLQHSCLQAIISHILLSLRVPGFKPANWGSLVCHSTKRCTHRKAKYFKLLCYWVTSKSQENNWERNVCYWLPFCESLDPNTANKPWPQ